MAAVTVTNKPVRHVLGDLVLHRYALSAVANGSTLTVPGTSMIEVVTISPTTTTYAGYNPAASVSGNVITFTSSNAWSGTVMVIARTG